MGGTSVAQVIVCTPMGARGGTQPALGWYFIPENSTTVSQELPAAVRAKQTVVQLKITEQRIGEAGSACLSLLSWAMKRGGWAEELVTWHKQALSALLYVSGRNQCEFLG